jgi:serine/threonine-protein kinase HipA
VSHVLNVYLGSIKVGRLWLVNGRRFSFQYVQDWLAGEHSVPLSIGLPLRLEPYADDAARAFFTNLLPESELRKVIARKLGISEGNDYALLEAIGGECAGAVTLLPEGVPFSDTGKYRLLLDEQLNALIKELPGRPMLAGETGIRLSLAGAQNKLPVYYDDSVHQVYLPVGSRASSHILKPPIAHYPGTVENELFCMQLAGRMGLPVPATTLLHKEQMLYLVRRYDRPMDKDGSVVRLHQEDFCQALGIVAEMKYEKEGGPSLQRCFDLLRNISMTPVVDIRNLLGWVAFNYLIGNADAHGKNISLLFREDGPILAPFYDLMSTAVYPGLNEHMAMRVGGEDRPLWIMTRHWEQFASDIGMGFKIIRQRLREMAEKIVLETEVLQKEFTEQYGEHEIINQIAELIRARSSQLLTRINSAE